MSTNTSKIFIRQAKKNDLKKIRYLVSYLMTVEEVDDVKRQTEIILKQRIIPTFGNKINKTFVAEDKEKIVGLVIIEVKHKIIAYLPYLVIDPLYQKQGIGNKLIKYVENYAKGKSIKIVEVLIHKDNKKSKQFHQKIGFDLFGHVLRKKIKKN